MSDTEDQSVALPLQLALGLMAAALVVAIVGGGLRHGSILGALLAIAATIPAGYAAWLGLQAKTQGKLVVSMLVLLGAVGLAGLLVVLRVFAWF